MKLKNKIYKSINNLYYKARFAQLMSDNSGMGVVEVILIIIEIYINYLYVFNVYIKK